jgi:hypothetical protein
MCGETMVRNLLKANGGVIRYPAADDDGSIVYQGHSFALKELTVPENEGD